MSGNTANKTRILVTDDEESIRGFLEELLTRDGYEVLTASCGSECLECARDNVPDLILLDVVMPDMSGGMTAHHLSESIVTRDIPIIFLTSIITREQEMVVENKEGTYPFLSKPIDVNKLRDEISKTLNPT